MYGNPLMLTKINVFFLGLKLNNFFILKTKKLGVFILQLSIYSIASKNLILL